MGLGQYNPDRDLLKKARDLKNTGRHSKRTGRDLKNTGRHSKRTGRDLKRTGRDSKDKNRQDLPKSGPLGRTYRRVRMLTAS